MKRNKIIMIIFSGLVLLIAALYLIYVYAPVPAEPHLTSAHRENTIQVGTMTRRFISYQPAQVPAKPALVIVLHGTNIDGSKIRQWTGYEFDKMADQYGFLVAYPDGYDKDWNDCRTGLYSKTKRENIDDVGFIKELINSYRRQYDVDPAKVYLFGYSSGGMMAFRMGMQEPGLIAAIVSVCAALPTDVVIHGKMPRMMLVNGGGDRICPVNGGELNLFGKKRGQVVSADETALAFARSRALSSTVVKSRLPHVNTTDETSVDKFVWSSGVSLFIVNKGGHVVPQPIARFPRIMGKMTGDLDTPKEAVAFFGLVSR